MKTISALFFLTFLVACSSGGSGQDNPNGVGLQKIVESSQSPLPSKFPYESFGGRLTDAEMDAAISRLQMKISNFSKNLNNFDSLSAKELSNTFAAHMKNDPDLFSLSIHPKDFSVTLQLRDGTPYVIVTKYRKDGSPRKLDEESITVARASNNSILPTYFEINHSSNYSLSNNLPISMDADVFPAGKNVYLINNFPEEELHSGVQKDLAKIFKSVGYKPLLPSSTVQELRNLSDIDVLWIDSHGTFSNVSVDKKGKTVPIYGLILGEKFQHCVDTTPEDCKMHKAELEKFNVVLGGNIAHPVSSYWLITSNFIKEHWKFKSHQSIVYIDACDSGSNNSESIQIRKTLEENGVGQIYGWKGTVYNIFAADTVKNFFDLALATTRFYKEPLVGFRPFYTNDVFAYLKEKGALNDNTPGSEGIVPGSATLELFQPTAEAYRLLLRPSLRNMVVDESKNQVQLLGSFGNSQGKVTIDGEPVKIIKWENDVYVQLPSIGKGSAGPVIVEYNDLLSNPVPLTLWKGTIARRNKVQSRFGPPGFDYQVTCDVSMRGDIHLFRYNTISSPKRGAGGDTQAIILNQILNSKAGSCEWSVTGSGIQGNKTTIPEIAPGFPKLMFPGTGTDQFNLSFWQYLGMGQSALSFSHGSGVAFKTYDSDGKLYTEGEFQEDFNSEFLNEKPPRFENDFSIQYNESGQMGADPEDKGNIQIQIFPTFLPEN